MRIKSVSFRNFGSYGNKDQTVEFSNETGNFYLVVGSNGAGKSTISDAIKFGLYGKLDTKKMSDIPNRFNGAAAVKIIIQKNPTTEVTIERGVWPNFFRVYINGREYDQAGKKNVQTFLEEEILGMPYYVFNNVISLSVNDFRSFISMGTNDKRLIIDRIFGLEILNHMRWKIREEVKIYKEDIDRLGTEISVLERSITNSSFELNSLNEKLKNASEEKKVTYQEQINECVDFIEKVNERLSEVLVKEKELKSKISDFTDVINENRRTMSNCKEKQHLYEKGKCPQCESDLTTDFHKGILQDYLEKSDEAKETIEKLNELVSTVNGHIQKIDTMKSELNKKRTTASVKLSMLKSDLVELDNNKVTDDQTESLTNIISDSQDKKTSAIEKKDIQERKVNFYKIMEDIYGDKGVKLSAIRRILPILNTEIKKVLQDLGMEYRVVFNQEFNAEISYLGFPVSVETLSTGEKKKIDFAALIAIIRLLKIKFHGINLIFLDEIFSSIDSDGVYHVLKILSNMSKELNLNIFVINHSPLPTELFDFRVDIEKNNGFSSFEISPIN
jgi:DNA repair exonuclease SbcCD ATPase subunit